MAPRQRATFDKKGKVKSMNYKEYSPRQEKASAQLESYIRNNQDKKNEAPGIKSILQDMPQKKADFVRRNVRKDGTLNSAAQALLAPYRDERPEYSRQLNRLVKSSPEMAQAYEKRFPIQNFMQNVAPRFMPVVGQLFSADQGMKANAAKQAIMNTPVNRPEGGFKNFVDFFKKDMTNDQAAKINIIEDETIGLQDPNRYGSLGGGRFDYPGSDLSFDEMNELDEGEKSAIEAALTPGDIVYNPVDAEKQSKLNFINKVFGTDFGNSVDTPQGPIIDQMFEKAKQQQGMVIRDKINIEKEAPITGQFDLTDQGAINLTGAPDQTTEGLREQIDMNTADPNLDIFTNEAFMGSGPNFPAGGVKTDGNINTGLDLVGDRVFPSEDGSQTALDILNSNADPYSSGYPTMRFDDGGYAKMSTFEKLKMMADNYGK